MIHKICVPDCYPALTWIVQLQTDLLTALCADGIGAADITAQWVAARRSDIDQGWIKRFCSWTKDGKAMLERMQGIAALSTAIKKEILQHFTNNLQYTDAFDSSKNPPQTVPLQNGLNEGAAEKYCAFLELFYDPIFYKGKGFPVHADGKGGGSFHRDSFLEGYKTFNDNIRVCPLCDGGLDGSEVDHWLAKKHFPEFACHPYNLVEICGACNSRSNKGEKPALSISEARPFDDWFHPYLRPAAGAFTIQIEEKGVVTLTGGNAQDQARITNLDKLINLCKRWKNEYKVKFKGVLKKIYGRKSRGQVFTEQSLKAIIDDWLGDIQSQVGIEPHALIEEGLLLIASDVNSYVFKEFLDYAINC